MGAVGPDVPWLAPTARRLRTMLAFGALSSIVAGIVALARVSGVAAMDDPVLADLSWMALLLFGAAAAMAVLAILVILVSALGTARVHARLERTQALADWRFEPAEWADWLATERGHEPFTTTMFMICSGVAIGVTAWLAYPTWAGSHPSERMGTVLVAASAIAVIGSLFVAARWASRSKASTMRDRPRVIVLDDAISCGGVVYRWGERMIVLRSVKLVPGSPTVLEVTIGQSAGLRAVSTVATLLALLAGRGGLRVPDTTFRFPVPAGGLDEARDLMHRLLRS